MTPVRLRTRYAFRTAGRILFGPGGMEAAVAFAAERGGKALLVSSRSLERSRTLRDALAAKGVAIQTLFAQGEPTVTQAEQGAALAREWKPDSVIAFGGGSAIDLGKAVAGLAANSGPIIDYLEGVGNAKPLTRNALPCAAMPTTAGAGAEVTPNAVLVSEPHGAKVSLRSPRLLPQLAIVDPELTLSMPPAVTASTGMDALTQLLEAYVSNHASPLTDPLCVEGLSLASGSLHRAFDNGESRSDRWNMSLASLFGGLALANSRLGAIHGLAAAIGGTFQAPHGAVCARLLPEVMDANLLALQRRERDSPAQARYEHAARIFTDFPSASAQDGVAWARELVRSLGVPGLAEHGVKASSVLDIVGKALRTRSMQGNPVVLTAEELAEIVLRAL